MPLLLFTLKNSKVLRGQLSETLDQKAQQRHKLNSGCHAFGTYQLFLNP